MLPLPFSIESLRFAFVTALSATLALVAGSVQAQTQESGLLDRINHPDQTLAFPLSNKNFGKTAAFKNKEVSTHSFGFGKTANLGGGAFRTHSFESSAYKPKEFALKDGASPEPKAFAQTNKLFDTRSVDVRGARDANKTLAVRAYDAHDAFAIQGKRQDTYDEMLKRKKLSIDEVRELLNKNK